MYQVLEKLSVRAIFSCFDWDTFRFHFNFSYKHLLKTVKITVF